MDTPQKIGRYEIVEELGRGAMGTVYRAKDPAMDRVVALKTIISVALESQQGNEFRERFYREARAAGGLAHPGIVPVFDVGEHEGVPYLVMEFISGRTLADSVNKGERLSIDRVCEMGQKIAEALGYAHQHGVVHRDIKPANILLTSREAHGIERPKITDFGVAKMAEGQTTRTGQMVGTPAFMPPEQFTGAPIDGRADIFSLGVVLYWLATGEQPFPGDSLTAVSYKVVHTEPVPPSKLNPAVPAGLENIIMKCLAKNPEKRYQTGEELARDLGQLRTGNKTAAVRIAAPRRAVSGVDPDATVIGPTLMGTPVPAAATRPAEHAIASQDKSNNRLILIGAILAVVVAAGGWYAMSGRQKSADTPVATPPAPMNSAPIAAASEPPATAPAPPTPATSAPNANAPKEVAAATMPATEAPAKKAAPPAKTAAKTGADSPAKAAAVDFDPKALDPKQNAKMKIDAEHMPASLEFTVEMNGKIYLQKTGAAAFVQNGDLFVPPGVQEFRVKAKSGAVEKASNTVSAEFKAKKKNTLKIELRMNGTREGAGMPQGLYEDSQIVLTLK
ncbi:MAG: protein kinase [Acidobacteriia bacterium]|nr:protein kinase [Terriglobia bacterium]